MKASPHQKSQRRGIIAGGSWVADRIKIISDWPAQETLVRILDTDQQGGGCAHNLAVDIRKLDDTIPVEAIGLIGADQDGDFLLSTVTSAGIDTSQLIRTDGLTTSFTDVMSVEGSGKRTFFHHAGANDELSPDNFDLSRCNGKILHLGLLGIHSQMDGIGDSNDNGWVTVLKAAQALGIQTNIELVSIEPQLIRDVATPCIPHLNTLIINDYELSALADQIIQNKDGSINVDKVVEAALFILDYSKNHGGALSLVIMHSPQVAVTVTSNKAVHVQESFKVHKDNIISTVGAGDAFAAGMLYGIHEEWPIDRSMRLAHAVAATSLLSANSVSAVSNIENCLKIAKNLNKTLIS